MRGMFASYVLGFLLISANAWSAEKKCEFAPATYAGEGKWQNFADEEDIYQVTTEFKGAVIDSVYKINDEQTLKLHMTVTNENGACRLSVTVDGKAEAGSGHCSDVGCTYRVKADDLRLEEHFMLQNNQLYRVGFKVNPSKGDKGIISWAERLPKK